jgi:hypothetical protein
MMGGIRRRWLVVGLGVVVAGVVAMWFLWPSAGTQPAPRERQYGSFTACLLTDDQGLSGEPAKAAWAGMQHASVTYSVKVQYLSVTGPQTAANAGAYFNSLALQRCAMILAAGDAPIGAMMEAKARFSGIVYVAIGGPPGALGVTTVETSPPEAVQAWVDSVVSVAARGAK